MKRTLKDSTGTVIRKGDTIIYPVRQGSDMWINMAYVEGFDGPRLKVRAKAQHAWTRRFASWPTTIYCIDRVTVVPDSNDGVQNFLIDLMMEGKTEALRAVHDDFRDFISNRREA